MAYVTWLERAKDMIGKTYNRLTIIAVLTKKSPQGHTYVDCVCSCGTQVIAQANNVASGNTKSCGCLDRERKASLREQQKLTAKTKALELIGKTFGILTITGLSDKVSKYGHAYVKADCKCGKRGVDIAASSLRKGRNITCGCRSLGGKRDKRYAKDPRLSSAKRVYRNSYKDGTLSFDSFLKLSQEDCFYCGAAPSNRINMYPSGKLKGPSDIANGWFIYNGLDRIDNSRSHDTDNVVPCCIDCNKAKMKRTSEEFFAWIKRIYNKHFKKRQKK